MFNNVTDLRSDSADEAYKVYPELFILNLLTYVDLKFNFFLKISHTKLDV